MSEFDGYTRAGFRQAAMIAAMQAILTAKVSMTNNTGNIDAEVIAASAIRFADALLEANTIEGAKE
jgi:hypothetical protein